MAQNTHVKRIYSLFIPNNKKQLVSDYFSANSEFIHKKGWKTNQIYSIHIKSFYERKKNKD
jgi:hypothetical protein